VLVVRGEAGVGKSALVEHTERSAVGTRVLRTVGIEPEMELEFAALHQLCQPLMDGLPSLPSPQRAALEVVLGMREGSAPDRFLVGLAVLGIMSHASEGHPLLCVVEDAHWLDEASAQVLAFVGRRLLAESIALLFCTRSVRPELLALPELEVMGLAESDSRTLLDSVAPAGLEPDICDRIIAESHGNPLALLGQPHGVSLTQLAGGLGLVSNSTPPGQIERSFLDRIRGLPEPTRRLLLVAAAEPSGDPDLLNHALQRLDLAIPPALTDETEGLLRIDERVTFQHPLARSAAYRAAGAQDRRRAHQALAEISDPSDGPERRSWHLASAATTPDEEVARDLERSAEHANARGRVAPAAALLQRSVALSEDALQRTNRALSAAAASLHVGDFETVRACLETAERNIHDSRQQGRNLLVRGKLAFASGTTGDTTSMLLEAARLLEIADPRLAGEAYLDAWGMAAAAGEDSTLLQVSRTIRAVSSLGTVSRPIDQLLRGYALLVTGDRAAAVCILQQAAPAIAEATPADVISAGWAATGLGPSVWDDHLMRSILDRQVRVCRDAGALSDLAGNLTSSALATAWTGDFAAARCLLAEADAVAAATGLTLAPSGALWSAALRGREDEALALIDSTIQQARTDQRNGGRAVAYWSAAALFNGLAKYDRAAVAARMASELPGPWTSIWALPELVEAAVRTSADDVARAALNRLVEATEPCHTDWALGITARCRALLSDPTHAEGFYREAVERLGATGLLPERARAQLLYGEWLRRRGRRLDARAQLRRAHELFTAIEMQAFAERARRELQSTGAIVRKRADINPSSQELTPQESQIALLVRDGYSNPEVGTRLFLSPRTVEWHLRKIFAKLSISSRRQLRDVLPRARFEPEPQSAVRE
jgi:DNA-binding NarL/FixJ family response regulator